MTAPTVDDVREWMTASGRGYLAATKAAAKHFGIPIDQARAAWRATPPPAPKPEPTPQPQPHPAPPLLEFPLAPIPRPQHEPGTLAWYESELLLLQACLDAARSRGDRVDAQGIAALQRQVIAIAERCRELRAQAAASSTKGQTLEQREQRLTEAAKKMPTPLLEIFAMEWALRNKVDLTALREARLVRAEERG